LIMASIFFMGHLPAGGQEQLAYQRLRECGRDARVNRKPL
jgi:hypothetical protein